MLIGAGGAGAWQLERYVLQRPGPLPGPRDVVVPRGTAAQVAESLAQDGVIDNRLAFRALVLLTRREGSLHAAELAFPAQASLRTVLTVLRTARPVEHLLTIPEGATARQITALLDRADALTGPAPTPADGALLPQTYAYERGTARAALAERATAAMDRTLAKLWEERDPNLPLATPREALTLASIVERETARPEERAHIAAVFFNRLRLGMKLQSDPTVVYAASQGAGILDRPLGRADLDRDDPYNTYRIRGLPPGPIAAPGIAALRAVMHPTPSDDLFFVADGSGGHAFSRTLEDHSKHVARWRVLESAPKAN